MNTSTVGKITGSLLVIMAGFEFGIAQADGAHMVHSLYDSSYYEELTVTNAPEEDMDQQGQTAYDSPYYEELTVTNAPEEDMDQVGPIMVGALPSEQRESEVDINYLDLGRE